jgi:acyl-CoA thioesterase-1
VVLCGSVLLACGGNERSATPAASSAASSAARASNKTANAPEGSGAPAGGAPATDARQTVLFLGTSLTAGLGLEPDSAYPQQLQRKIDAVGLPYQTVNAGVSGETSAGLLRRLDWVLQRPASVIVVETGANDGLRGLPVTATRTTIGQILARIRRDQPDARVALVQMEAPTNLGASYTTPFRAMFPALAREHGATLIPFLLDGVAGHPSLNQADGIHPNYAGERLVTETVWKGLEPVLRAR